MTGKQFLWALVWTLSVAVICMAAIKYWHRVKFLDECRRGGEAAVCEMLYEASPW